MYRLGVLESVFRDENAASQMYKLQHDYNMGKPASQCVPKPDQLCIKTGFTHYAAGGRKKCGVPFTWILKLAHVVPVVWNKQARDSESSLVEDCCHLHMLLTKLWRMLQDRIF